MGRTVPKPGWGVGCVLLLPSVSRLSANFENLRLCRVAAASTQSLGVGGGPRALRDKSAASLSADRDPRQRGEAGGEGPGSAVAPLRAETGISR